MLTSTLGQYFSAMELKAREDKNNIDFQVDVISESLRELQQGMKIRLNRTCAYYFSIRVCIFS